MEAELTLDFYALSRWLGYAALFGVTGACVFRLLLRRSLVRGQEDAELLQTLRAGARNAAIICGVLLIVSDGLRLYGQARTALDPGESMTMGAVTPWFADPAGWGRMWWVQLAAAVLALIGALVARWRRAGWSAAGIGVIVAALALPLTGHAIESRLGATAGVVLQGLHILAGGSWLGTLAVLLIVTLRATRRDADARERLMANLVNAYSPVALGGAGTAVAIGLVLAWVNVGSFGAFWGTLYGRVLLVKVGVLCGVVAVGAYNWKRVRPALGAAPGSRRIRLSATAELLIGALLLAVTALLVVLPAPRL